MSADEQCLEALRRGDGDSRQRGGAEGEVRHGQALERGEHRDELEEVHGVHERREDEVEVGDPPCDRAQPLVRLARGRPVGEDEREGAQLREAGDHFPHIACLGIAAALHGGLRGCDELERTSVLCCASRVVAGLRDLLIAAIYGELAVQMISGAREP